MVQSGSTCQSAHKHVPAQGPDRRCVCAQFVAWVVHRQQQEVSEPQLSSRRLSGTKRSRQGFLSGQVTAVQEAAMRCQVLQHPPWPLAAAFPCAGKQVVARQNADDWNTLENSHVRSCAGCMASGQAGLLDVEGLQVYMCACRGRCRHLQVYLCACMQGEMQDALTVVKMAIEAADAEFRLASERPAVVVRIEPLIAAPPKAGPSGHRRCFVRMRTGQTQSIRQCCTMHPLRRHAMRCVECMMLDASKPQQSQLIHRLSSSYATHHAHLIACCDAVLLWSKSAAVWVLSGEHGSQGCCLCRLGPPQAS